MFMEYMDEYYNEDVMKLETLSDRPFSGVKISENQTNIEGYFYYQSMIQFAFFQRWNLVRWIKTLKRGNWDEMKEMNEGFGSTIISPFESLERFIKDLKRTYGNNQIRFSDLGDFTVLKTESSRLYYITYNYEFYLSFRLVPAVDEDGFSYLYDDSNFTRIELELCKYVEKY